MLAGVTHIAQPMELADRFGIEASLSQGAGPSVAPHDEPIAPNTLA
jgi:hypothetical protein